jgi:stage II sporulation protein P
LRAMELPVPARFQSAAEMQAALSAPAAAPVSPPSPRVEQQPAPPRQATRVMPRPQAAAQPWWRRVPGWVWAVGGVGSAGLLMLCVAVVLGGIIGKLPAGAPAPTHRPTSTPAPRSTSVPTPSPIPTFVPMTRPAATVGAEAMVVAQAGGTNLRSGPGTDFPVVGRLEADEAARITGRYGDWWQVDYAGTPAWVANWVVTATHADRVPEVVPPSSPLPPTAVPPTAGPARTPLGTATPRPDGSIVHVVQPGETLLTISLMYNVPLEQLRELNDLENDIVYVGQVLVISVLDRPTPAR